MAVTLPPPYPRAPIGEITQSTIPGQSPEVTLTQPWSFYFRDQRQYLSQLPVSVTPSVTPAADQNDAIGTTTIFTPTQDGLYSFEYYLAITTADGTSSSAQVTVAWTDTLAKSHAFTAITGDTTTTTGSERYLFFAQAGAPITYAVSYASNTPNAMVYTLYPLVQSVASVVS